MNSNGHTVAPIEAKIEAELKQAADSLNEPAFPFEAECFSLERPFEMPTAIISVDGEIISTAGNITTIAGQAKSGKSAVVSSLLAGAIAPKGGIIDTLGFNVQYNGSYKAVLHFDTEQSDYNHYKTFSGIYRRTGRHKDLDNFRSFNLRKYPFADRRKFIEESCTLYGLQCGGVFIIVIDGIADLLSSPNDEEESNGLIDWTEKLAITHNCPVVTVLHFNPGSEKERGHLGSQLQRKSESVLSVMKLTDTQESRIQGRFLRNAGEIPEISFEYDKAKGYHVLISKVSQLDKRNFKEIQKQAEITSKHEAIKVEFEAVLGNAWLKNKDLIAGYMDRTGFKNDAANKHLRLVKDLFGRNDKGEYGRK
jgi:hypothetical protein